MGRERVERRIVTVLFADIVGFTTLSERLDAEDVATVQEAYFASVREIVARYGGRLEKFIGDAAMAVFGLPVARDDDAERAVRAGLALAASVEHLGARIGLDEAGLQVRVGVNTGEVISSEPAPGDWRVTGDTVNTAARLQTASSPGRVLVGEVTALSVADSVELEPARPIELKGKAAPVHASRVLGLHPDRSRERAMGSLRAPTLGRDDELARLEAAVGDLAPPRRTARWLVVAPPGVGKSRLLAELAARLGPEVCVLRTQLRPETDAPFAAIAQLARDALAWGQGEPGSLAPRPDRERLTDALRSGGARAARAGVLAEELALLLESGGAESAVPAGSRPIEQSARFAAWIEAFDLLACSASAVWLLEDLHWAGPDLLAFVDQVHATPAPRGRLVIGTARPSLLEREPGWCGPREDQAIHRLDLAALPARSARELVAALLRGDCLPDSLVERIVERSDGNPLFIEELLRIWISLGILVMDDAGCTLVDPERTIDLPATVQAIYAGQLDDLPPDARLLARRASVAGRSFPVEGLPALEAPSGEALEGLRIRRLVDGPAPAELGPSYAYRHALLRDAGYATLARLERARLHVRLADWMRAAGGDRADRLAETIAHHYESAVAQLPALVPEDAGLDRAALVAVAATWLERAGVTALAASAQANARELLKRCLAISPDGPSLDRARRLSLLGEATAFSGDMDAGVRAYREAAEIYRAILGGDPAEASAARDGYASVALAEGTLLVEQLQFRAALALAQEALAYIGPGDDLATARLRHLSGWARLAYQPGPEAEMDLEAALAGAERAGDPRLRLDATWLLQHVRAEKGTATPAELRTQAEEVAALAQELGVVRRAAAALRERGLYDLDRDPAAGLPWMERSASLAEAHGLLEELAWVGYGRTEIGLAIGDWDAAVADGLAALELAEANAYHRPVVRTWFALSPIALARGRRDLLERAKAWFDPRRATFPDSPYGRFMRTAMDLRFAAVGLMDPFVPAEDLLDMWDEAPGAGSWQAAVATVVGAWVDAGRHDLARRALERTHAWDDHPFVGPAHHGVTHLLEARLHLADGDPPAALGAIDRALASFDEVPTAWARVAALRLRARILEAQRAPAPEVAVAEEAAARAERELGMPAPA